MLSPHDVVPHDYHLRKRPARSPLPSRRRSFDPVGPAQFSPAQSESVDLSQVDSPAKYLACISLFFEGFVWIFITYILAWVIAWILMGFVSSSLVVICHKFLVEYVADRFRAVRRWTSYCLPCDFSSKNFMLFVESIILVTLQHYVIYVLFTYTILTYKFYNDSGCLATESCGCITSNGLLKCLLLS